MSECIAWDGTADEFWAAVRATRDNVDIESDAAVLSEVLALAQAAERLRTEVDQLRMQYPERIEFP